jgi:hypothetical protein
MLKYSIMAILLGVTVLASGCQTMTSDSEQQIRKYSRIADLNRRMLADDVDAILLLDRPSNLSQWHVRSY